MRIINVIISSILLISTPSFLAFPQDYSIQKSNLDQTQAVNNYFLSYDKIIRLLEELESGELEKRYSSEDLDKINRFFVFLAKQGALPSDFTNALEEDIADLLDTSGTSFFHTADNGYILPTFFNYDDSEIVLCKSWFKKTWKKTKKFVKKHKKEILIGAGVVIGVVAIVVAVVAATAAPAAAGAASAIGGATSSNLDRSKEGKEGDSEAEISDSSPLSENETPIPHLYRKMKHLF